MNPNMTISHMAAQAKRREMERGAERGWMAEQAAAQRKPRQRDLADSLKRLLTAIVGWPRRVVRQAAGIDVPAGMASPRLDRVG